MASNAYSGNQESMGEDRTATAGREELGQCRDHDR